MSIKEYFVSIFKGFYSLIKGMEVTGKELVTPKVFRATLEFIYDDNGYHKCIACGSCERNCPNQTISITKRMVDLPDGKKKMKLDKYMYDLGSCTFCGLCVQVCPTNAIRFSNDFEQAVFTREKLNKQLNYLPEKDDAPAPAPAAKPAAPAAPKPAEPKPALEAPAAADETNQKPKENKE